MTGFSGLEFPKIADWQAFERLCRDLFAAIWNDEAGTQLNGRGGQPQAGVDVFGDQANGWCGVQCKRRGGVVDNAEVSEEELRAEVAKALTFDPPIARFILASTAPRDAKIQAVARVITEEHAASRKFSVQVVSWSDIEDRLGDHPKVAAKHFSGIYESFRRLDMAPGAPSAEPSAASGNTSSNLAGVALDLGAVVEAEHRAQISAIREEVKTGFASRALAQADALRSRIWAASSPGTRAQLEILRGHCYLELGDVQKAGEILIAAVDHAPDNAMSQANTAFGHFLLDHDAAARTWVAKALTSAPTNLIAIQVSILLDNRRDDEVLAEHEQTLGPKAEIYTALGHRAAKRRDFVTARSWFEKALPLASDSAEASAVLGSVIVDEILVRRPGLIDLSREDALELARAEKLLADTLDKITDAIVRKARVHWTWSLVSAKRLLGREDTSSRADAALKENPDSVELRVLRAAVAADAGEYQMVLSALEGVDSPAPDLRGLRATAKANLGDLEGARREWEGLLREVEPGSARDQARVNYVYVLLELHQHSEAEVFAASVLRDEPEALVSSLLAARVCERLGQTEACDKHLDDAIPKATVGAPAPSDVARLGDALMRRKRFSDAATIYERTANVESDSSTVRRLAEAQYRAGRPQAVLATCARLAANGVRSKFFAEMESVTHEELGDLTRARAVCERFLETEPGEANISLRLCAVLFRGGKREELKAAVEKVDRRAARKDLHCAALLAEFLFELGRPLDALEHAYQARRCNINSPDAHLMFLSRYFVTERAQHVPQTVMLGTAVKLDGVGAPREWVYVADLDEDDAAGQFPTEHPTTKALLGKRVGDDVRFDENPALKWTILEIESKYTRALRQTFDEYAVRFPGDVRLRQFRLPEDPAAFLSQLKDQLAGTEQVQVTVAEQYAARRITVGAAAIALGRSIAAGLAFACESASGLFAATNTEPEKKAAAAVFEDKTRLLVADVVAMVILDALNVLRSGELGKWRIGVAQTTIDELRQEATRLKQAAGRDSLSVGMRGGALVGFEATAEDIERGRNRVEGLLDWISREAEVVPVAPAMAESQPTLRGAAKVLGASSVDSLLIAGESNRGLLSDDAVLRHLFASAFPSGFHACTTHLLDALLKAGTITRGRYAKCVVTLHGSGYREVPVSADVLLEAASRENWRPQGILRALLSRLEGPTSTAVSALFVVAEFCKRLSVEPMLPTQRSLLYAAAFASLTAGRPSRATLAQLRVRLRETMQLVPNELIDLLRAVDAWEASLLR